MGYEYTRDTDTNAIKENTDIRTDYKSISEELKNVLNAVITYGLYVPNELADPTDNKDDGYYYTTNDIKIDITISNSGSTDGNSIDGYIIKIPKLEGSGGFTPVEDITGGYKNTFRQHDGNVTIVHEIGHVILQLLTNDSAESSELNIAVLAKAVAKVKSDPKTNPIAFSVELKKILGFDPGLFEVGEYKTLFDNTNVGWSLTKDKIDEADKSNSSYENIYNKKRDYTAKSGLSNISKELYRVGYGVHPGDQLGETDKHWVTINAGEGENYDGHYKNLQSRDKDLVMLGNKNDNVIQTEAGNDYLDGGHGNDTLETWDGKNILIGGTGEDTLLGGVGEDTLIGGVNQKGDDGAKDILKGGDRFDTYIVSNTDEITDDDGNGKIDFDGIDLSGRKTLLANTEIYQDDNFFYEKKGEALVVTKKINDEYIKIFGFDFGGTGKNSGQGLGIELVDNMDIEVSIINNTWVAEGDSRTESLQVTVHLSRALEDGEILEVSVSDTDERTYIFTSGEQDKNLTHSWRGDTIDEKGLDHTAIFIPTATYTGPTEDVKVTLISGKASIYDDDGGKKNNDNDDDDDDRYDPLALDMDKDGFISTSSLDESGTYFDITGDGLRERVGWIQSNDALLTYDKNENGQIDGISEVFGNPGESGFEELKRLIDSNHDNIIDRKDELYTRLQVWNDYNQDAKVQEGELRTLKEAGIKSIDLNYVATNIYIAI